MALSILCIVDFSEPSLRALEWAIDEAVAHHMHLSIVYPFRLQSASRTEDFIQMKKTTEAKALESFSAVENSHLKGKSVTYDFRSEVGFVRDRVEDRTRRGSVKEVVVSKDLVSAGRESFDEFVHSTSVPVVIIP